MSHSDKVTKLTSELCIHWCLQRANESMNSNISIQLQIHTTQENRRMPLRETMNLTTPHYRV
jgi:Ser-tRNA(Ala) deacylase AlaX